jgi:hypothetical protein
MRYKYVDYFDVRQLPILYGQASAFNLLWGFENDV